MIKVGVKFLLIVLSCSLFYSEAWSRSPVSFSNNHPFSQQKKTTPVKKRKTKETSPAKKNATSKKVTTKKSSSKPTPTKPKTSAEAKKQQQEAQKEIKETETRLMENEAKVSLNLSKLGEIESEIEVSTGKIAELNSKIGALDKEITGLESGIKKNESELTTLREEYLKAVKKMRVARKNKSTLAFIFSSKSVSQAMRRMRYLKEFSSWRERQTNEINLKNATLKKQKEDLGKARQMQEAALISQKSTQKKLATQKGVQEKLVAELKENSKALESHLQKKQAEAKELGNMVSSLIAEEQRQAEEAAKRKAAEEKRKAEEEARQKLREEELLAQETQKPQEQPSKVKEESSKSKERASKSKKQAEKKPVEYADARKRAPRGKGQSTPSNSTTAPETSDFESMRGKLPYPTTGSFTIVSKFGRQHLPDLPDVEYDNPGIDAFTDRGASARAVYKGKVSGVYLLPGYNTVVIVNHGNYYTVYGNISNPAVKIGDLVDAGKELGKLDVNEDDEQHSTIHFEVWKSREKQNPQEWLR